MVERPERSEDERPLHMWAPTRPQSGGEEGRQLTRACLPISASGTGPGWRLHHVRTGRDISRLEPDCVSQPIVLPRLCKRTMQLLGGLPGGCCLGGVSLCHPQPGHRVHQR